MNEHNCRVCGLFVDDLPWGENGNSPTYEICPCCGVEFGNEDYTVDSTKRYRSKWLSTGAIWLNKKRKPGNWNLEEQLKGIPQRYIV